MPRITGEGRRMAYTFQDLLAATDVRDFIERAINEHKASDGFRLALDADEYDAQRNVTINKYVRYVYNMSGNKAEDFTASTNRIASNFFNRLNTQRVDYSLGAGISFVQPDEEQDGGDDTKEKLGRGFDHVIHEAAYCAGKHGVSFVFWNLDHVHLFKLTEFVPLYDEHDGTLRAGIRFWRLSDNKPMSATLYREEGYSEWRETKEKRLLCVQRDGSLYELEDVRPYKTTVAYTPADDSAVVVGEENYGVLPIVPMWTSRLKQSTLVGMRSSIDAYDLVKSGFANDLQDCAQIYWIVKNAPGTNDADMQRFLDRLKLQHIAKVDNTDGGDVVPYSQQIPFEARQALLKELRDGIYEDFGGLDVHTVAAGATNDHIDAAYQPLDENASDFEYWVSECIEQVLALAGIDDSPVFTRQRISNQKEQVEMVVQEAQWLDTPTILRKLPNITPDEVIAILNGMEREDMGRYEAVLAEEEQAEEEVAE